MARPDVGRETTTPLDRRVEDQYALDRHAAVMQFSEAAVCKLVHRARARLATVLD